MSLAVLYQPLPMLIHTDGLSAQVAPYVRWQSSWARGSTTGDSLGKWSAAWGSQDVHKVPHPMRFRKKRRKRMRMRMKLRTSWTCLTWWALSVSKYRNSNLGWSTMMSKMMFSESHWLGISCCKTGHDWYDQNLIRKSCQVLSLSSCSTFWCIQCPQRSMHKESCQTTLDLLDFCS